MDTRFEVALETDNCYSTLEVVHLHGNLFVKLIDGEVRVWTLVVNPGVPHKLYS